MSMRLIRNFFTSIRDNFICKKCVESHKRMKPFASYKVASLEDLKQGQAQEIAVKEPPTIKCSLHEEPLTVFCFDCSSL